MRRGTSTTFGFLAGSLAVYGCSDDAGSPGGETPIQTGGAGGGHEAGGQGGATGSGVTGGFAGAMGGSISSGGNAVGGSSSGGVAGAASGGGGSGGMATGGASGHQFSIVFDSSLDATGWFDAPAVQNGLTAAASLWADRIRDDFEEIPVGTPILVRNLDQLDDTVVELVTTEPIDDLRVYVGCTDVLDSSTTLGTTRQALLFTDVHGADFQQRLKDRWFSGDEEPWVVGIAFACNANFFFDPTPETADDLPQDQPDFITLVAHELGHALGLGVSDAFLSQVSMAGTEFLGTNAVALFGGPVPLEADNSGHLLSFLTFDGTPVLMEPNTLQGSRVGPGALEFAMLLDIGYEISP